MRDSGLRGCLLWCVAAGAGVVAVADADAPLRAALAAALEANERLREELARRDAEIEWLSAELAVLQRMVSGWSSERARPQDPAPDGDGGGDPGRDREGGGKGRPRGPGARAGRRDYSHLPRFEVTWDFEGGGYCCPQCGEPFTRLGDHVVEQLDWEVIIRLAVHCRRRYRRACACPVPATVTAPGPPKAIGKGMFTNAFTAMLLTERYVAGRSQNSLVTGLARHGAAISAATLTGTCAQAGTLLVPLAEAITARSRDSWHLHADETSWRVLAPRDGDGPAKWWLWVFTGPDTTCFVMDPSRSGAVLAGHAGIDEETGQLTAGQDEGPRQLVISSDFYSVYQPAGKKADGLINLYCRAHIRRYSVRAGTPTRPGCSTGRRRGWTGSRTCTPPITRSPAPGRTPPHPLPETGRPPPRDWTTRTLPGMRRSPRSTRRGTS